RPARRRRVRPQLRSAGALPDIRQTGGLSLPRRGRGGSNFSRPRASLPAFRSRRCPAAPRGGYSTLRARVLLELIGVGVGPRDRRQERRREKDTAQACLLEDGAVVGEVLVPRFPGVVVQEVEVHEAAL